MLIECSEQNNEKPLKKTFQEHIVKEKEIPVCEDQFEILPLKIPDTLFEKLEQIAEAQSKNVEDVIKDALESFLKSDKNLV